MLKGFKDFLMRGNVIELATAVVMGTAFTAIVTSVTKGIVEPLLAVAGTNGQLGLGVQLVAGKPATFIAVGPIVSAGINFLMVATVLYFVLILPMNTLQKRFSRKKKAVPTQTELLIEIRDLLAGRSETATTDAVVDTDATEAQRRVAEMVHER
ncbi:MULTISPECIES: large conductance mechanosensitive channel protein MscL [Nocardia]|uniref:large conductance mechanosensitive channel protein MscL n=1 Tax=Nocardia TaxID=1817 RepID=UPI0007EBAF48|nr:MULTISPECIES: large conductance mechanosensitive channel protein MscL [Nocardia]OBF82906.1 mechanosensitive ion channel protein MscL [Mycobacterium sp. 852002-51759_SCH5129042]MBF6276348.1 large conductance mechanosensitive channel protein MscL [Nocardia nova]MBV7705778.1 large conductance mechanosensitive channel protein MscL [Nocardia nova]OBA46033.1 mechanosensitive ion channel protein MscL [Nocardia sp. 852002-51101_SCH5132738]OBB43187.1 mechanosensitive ion channel protein MscL [Nocard